MPSQVACLQTHVPFADALSGSQLGRIVMQEDFGMDQHDEQRLFLDQRQRFSLVQLVIAGSLPEKLLTFSPQRVSIRLMRMWLVGLQLAVQLPETLLEVLPRVGEGSECVGSTSCHGETHGSSRALLPPSTS